MILGRAGGQLTLPIFLAIPKNVQIVQKIKKIALIMPKLWNWSKSLGIHALSPQTKILRIVTGYAQFSVKKKSRKYGAKKLASYRGSKNISSLGWGLKVLEEDPNLTGAEVIVELLLNGILKFIWKTKRLKGIDRRHGGSGWSTKPI